MLAVTAKLLPAARGYARQIVPPVLATLIAALLIAGFNRAFSGHLVQPRMAALHGGSGETTRPIVYAANPHEEAGIAAAAPVSEPAVPERIFAKDDAREAGKDQTPLKVATAAPAVPAAAAPAPVTPRIVSRKAEPQAIEQRQGVEQRQSVEQRQVTEPREPRVAAVPVAVAPAPAPVVGAPAPVAGAPAPLITAPPVVVQPIAPLVQQPIAPPLQAAPSALPPVAQEPPPVISAKPMVTVPDRPGPAYPGYQQRAPYNQQAEQDLAPLREPRPLERFVDSLKPSSIFNRMREFGDRIEAAGNEILPNIRQQ
jgi:hypothetical protein